MSYATVDMVRRHLISRTPAVDRIRNQLLTFDSNDPIMFYAGDVEADSFRVKSLRSGALQRATLVLSALTPLSGLPLVEGSVVVASNSSLGHVFIENVDYVIDYDNGALAIKSSGALDEGTEVSVWYLSYYLYRSGSDYSLDAEDGYLRRLTGGDIALNEQVRLDYRPNRTVYSETVLASAVAEANGMVSAEVDPDRQFGAEPALQAAAVYRALEIVSLSAATRQLSAQPDSDRAALAWIKLAEQFAQRSRRYLDDFRPGLSGPVSPTHS
ncbi:MAG TPA: hypothetical protein PLF13_01900 [candidate division Zixibacteria bacterium]|nr:hypothetical protein [candidate division Zixibacteria bacterium]